MCEINNWFIECWFNGLVHEFTRQKKKFPLSELLDTQHFPLKSNFKVQDHSLWCAISWRVEKRVHFVMTSFLIMFFPRVEHLAKSLNFNLSFKSIHSVACCRLKWFQVKIISTYVILYFPLLRLGKLHLKQRKIQINLQGWNHFNPGFILTFNIAFQIGIRQDHIENISLFSTFLEAFL